MIERYGYDDGGSYFCTGKESRVSYSSKMIMECLTMMYQSLYLRTKLMKKKDVNLWPFRDLY